MALSVSVLNTPIVVISNYLIHTHKHICINKFVDRYIGFRNTPPTHCCVSTFCRKACSDTKIKGSCKVKRLLQFAPELGKLPVYKKISTSFQVTFLLLRALSLTLTALLEPQKQNKKSGTFFLMQYEDLKEKRLLFSSKKDVSF